MNARTVSSLLGLLLMLWAIKVFGLSDQCTTQPPLVQGEAAVRFDALLREYESGGFSGVVLVLHRGQPVLRQAYGFRNWEQQARTSVDTRFPIASVTKQYLAAAILRLEMEGQLRLSDPISKYLGKFPGQVRDATIQELLTHSSGLISSTASFSSSNSDEFVAELKRTPRESEPGQRYRYSNGGYALLAAIMERVSGKPIETFMEERVFHPAGMYCTSFRSDDNTAKGYEVDESQISETIAPSVWRRILGVRYRPSLRPASLLPSDWSIRASGGIVSTLSDIENWELALRRKSLLSKKAQTEMFMPRFQIDGDQSQAYAWIIEHAGSTRQVARQYGDYWGYQSAYIRYSDGDWVLFLATNVNVGRGPEGWRTPVRTAFEHIFLPAQ